MRDHQKKEGMRGRVVNWSRPCKEKDRDGLWTSEIELETGDDNDSQKSTKKMCLKTRSAEEHAWIPGSWIQVSENGSCTPLQIPYRPHFVNVDTPIKIVGLVTKGHNRQQNTVILEAITLPLTRQPVVCSDSKLWTELVPIGIGSWIRLYNVTTTTTTSKESNGDDSMMTLTERSGIRKVSMPHPSKESSPPPASASDAEGIKVKMKKWECLNCGWLNFISKSVCVRCNVTRRDEPLPADWIPRKAKQSWECRHCHFEKNFFNNQSCWKCGRRGG